MEYVKQSDASKLRDENTMVAKKCVASLNFIASLHICRLTAVLLASSQKIAEKTARTSGPQLDFWLDLIESSRIHGIRLAAFRVVLSVLVNGQSAKLFFSSSTRTLPLLLAHIPDNNYPEVTYICLHILWILLFQNQRLIPQVKSCGLIDRLQALGDDPAMSETVSKVLQLV